MNVQYREIDENGDPIGAEGTAPLARIVWRVTQGERIQFRYDDAGDWQEISVTPAG